MKDSKKLERLLTPAAKRLLDQAVGSYRDEVIQRSFESMGPSAMEAEEISYSDVQTGIRQSGRTVSERKSRARVQIVRIVVASGIAYALVGIVLFFLQNFKFDISRDFGLILAVLGFAVAAGGISLSLAERMNVVRLKRASRAMHEVGEEDLELSIIRSWQRLETSARNVLPKSDRNQTEVMSLRQLIGIMRDLKLIGGTETNKLLEALSVRNAVVHQGKKVTRNEAQEYTSFINTLVKRIQKFGISEK